MLIALDYDGTYTADPDLWNVFIANARDRGHSIVVATMRHNALEGDEVRSALGELVDLIVFTERKAKKQFLRNMNIIPDIWIDDNPDWLYEDSIPSKLTF